MSPAGFEIAGFGLEFASPLGATQESLERWGAFASSSEPQWHFVADRLDALAKTGPRTMPALERNQEGDTVVRGSGFEARLDLTERRVELRHPEDDSYAFETVVKLLLADSLLESGGLLLHGVGVAMAGRAGLFVGPSGAGKSTLGALCQASGMELLADELVAVRPEAGGYVAMGTPWNRGAPLKVRLAFVGTLGWASAPRLEPQEASSVLRALLPNALLPWSTPECRAAVFRAAGALLEKIPTRRLQFPRTPATAALLAQGLREFSA